MKWVCFSVGWRLQRFNEEQIIPHTPPHPPPLTPPPHPGACWGWGSQLAQQGVGFSRSFPCTRIDCWVLAAWGILSGSFTPPHSILREMTGAICACIQCFELAHLRAHHFFLMHCILVELKMREMCTSLFTLHSLALSNWICFIGLLQYFKMFWRIPEVRMPPPAWMITPSCSVCSLSNCSPKKEEKNYTFSPSCPKCNQSTKTFAYWLGCWSYKANAIYKNWVKL